MGISKQAPRENIPSIARHPIVGRQVTNPAPIKQHELPTMPIIPITVGVRTPHIAGIKQVTTRSRTPQIPIHTGTTESTIGQANKHTIQ
jgi:hypothetical protein